MEGLGMVGSVGRVAEDTALSSHSLDAATDATTLPIRVQARWQGDTRKPGYRIQNHSVGLLCRTGARARNLLP